VTTLELDGATALRKSLDAAGEALGDLTGPNKVIAQRVLASAIPRVPVRTGRLVGSLQPHATATVATVTTAVPYAWPVHSGVPARNIGPHPFLTGALSDTEEAIVDVYLEAVDDALAGVHS
jgi:hypothetical protein